MAIINQRLELLFQLYADNNCTRSELLELLRLIEQSEEDEELHAALLAVWQQISSKDELPEIDRNAVFLKVLEGEKKPAVITFFPYKNILRYAAVILLVAGAGGGLWWYVSDMQTRLQPVDPTTPLRANAEVLPGGNRAVLTLADGSTIVLDSAANGNLTSQGNTQIIKLNNGQLAYNLEGSPQEGRNRAGASSGEPSRLAATGYNTISTPRGGQYQIVLPDGSKVWLNAASSIRFPTVFSGKQRDVELTGEAYFEVAPSQAGPPLPFRVKLYGAEVLVLATSFNINAYDEEKTTRTTLLEGAVKVFTGQSEALLKPGQQARITPGTSTIQINDKIDIAEVIAWKNGLFHFNRTDLRTVMQQLARWYDIEVAYQDNVSSQYFSGKIQRDLNLSDVLEILKKSKVHLRIEGRKLIVLP